MNSYKMYSHDEIPYEVNSYDIMKPYMQLC